MTWLSDIRADIAAGNLREIPGDEYDRLFWCRLRGEYEAKARRLAEVHGYDIAVLENQRVVSLFSLFGTQPFEDFPLFKRAIEIARERQQARAA